MLLAAAVLASACSDDGGAEAPLTSTGPPSGAETTTTTTPPVTGCGALLDGAEVIENAAAAVDIDGDGEPDNFHWSEPTDDEGGSLVQVVRSSDGTASSAVRLVGFLRFGGPIDSADLDGDGLDEVFFSLSGNTLLSGVVLELDGCALRAVTTDALEFDYGDGLFTYPYFAGGNSCAPSGCYNPVICREGTDGVEIVLTQIFPVTSALDPDFDPEASDAIPHEELPVFFVQQVVRVAQGHATVVESAALSETVLGEVGEWTRHDGVVCRATLES